MTTEKQPQSTREKRRSERREAILDIAQAAFLKNGYAETTMSSIAARMGGSKTTLWTYYHTKQDLFGAVLVRAANALEGRLLDALDLDKDIEQSIRHFCEIYAQIISSPESIALHRLVIAEGARFPEIGQSFFDFAIATTRQILIAFLTNAARMGLLTIPDPLVAADLLRSMCHGNCFQTLIFNVTASDLAPVCNSDGEVAANAFLQMFRLSKTESLDEVRG